MKIESDLLVRRARYTALKKRQKARILGTLFFLTNLALMGYLGFQFIRSINISASFKARVALEYGFNGDDFETYNTLRLKAEELYRKRSLIRRLKESSVYTEQEMLSFNQDPIREEYNQGIQRSLQYTDGKLPSGVQPLPQIFEAYDINSFLARK